MSSRGGEPPKMEELWLFTSKTPERMRTKTMPPMPISFWVTVLWSISLVVSWILFKTGIVGQNRFANVKVQMYAQPGHTLEQVSADFRLREMNLGISDHSYLDRRMTGKDMGELLGTWMVSPGSALSVQFDLWYCTMFVGFNFPTQKLMEALDFSPIWD